MRSKVSILFLLVVAFASSHAVGGGTPIRIELPANVAVARSQVSLGDVASMSTTDLQNLKRLMVLSLGPAPRAGEKAQLSRVELMRWIQKRTGIEARQIVWEGASVTEMYRASSEITGARLAAVAVESLRTWLGGHSTRADVALAATPRDVTVPFGQSTLKVRPIPHDGQPARRMLVWVDIWVEDRFVRTVPISFDVAAYGPAYVCDGDLPLGTRVDASSVTLREVELTGRAAPAATPQGGVLDSGERVQMRRPLAAGKVLTRLDVESQAAVSRGEWVALRVRSGFIEMESRAEALQNGRVGQTVSVRTSTATTPLAARVVGPGQVEVLQ
jgi:flagellar basal body P-ring formation protein FlgA